MLPLALYLGGLAAALLVVACGPFRPRGVWQWAAGVLLALLWPVAAVVAGCMLVVGDREGRLSLDVLDEARLVVLQRRNENRTAHR